MLYTWNLHSVTNQSYLNLNILELIKKEGG